MIISLTSSCQTRSRSLPTKPAGRLSNTSSVTQSNGPILPSKPLVGWTPTDRKYRDALVSPTCWPGRDCATRIIDGKVEIVMTVWDTRPERRRAPAPRAPRAKTFLRRHEWSVCRLIGGGSMMWATPGTPTAKPSSRPSVCQCRNGRRPRRRWPVPCLPLRPAANAGHDRLISASESRPYP